MRISDWSSDVCSSDLLFVLTGRGDIAPTTQSATPDEDVTASLALNRELCQRSRYVAGANNLAAPRIGAAVTVGRVQQLVLLALWEGVKNVEASVRSEEHTSELQSLMRISYAVFCLKKKKQQRTKTTTNSTT